MSNHVFNEEITNKVIELRKTTNLKLPDAIIASTALINNLELWTHNIKDFKKVHGLKLYNPIAKQYRGRHLYFLPHNRYSIQDFI